MDESTFTASTESAAPADSGASAPMATSASGDGVSEQVSQQTSEPVVTAPVADGESNDAGWSLDDILNEQAPAESEDEYSDSALEQLGQEQGLDQSKVPGLVQAVRQLREERKTLRAEAAQLRAEREQMESSLANYGGLEGVQQSYESFAPLLRGEEGAGEAFLQSIWQEANPSYGALADAVIKLTSPKYLLDKMREHGKLPESLAAASQAPARLDAETLATIPQHLHDVAKRLALENPEYVDDLLLQPEGLRNFNLERELKLSQMNEQQQAFERQQWDTKVAEAETAGQTAVRSLSEQHEQAHYKELEKWKPFGENAEANQRLYRDVVEGAFSELLQDQKFAKMREDATRMLREAPLLKLHGQAFKANEFERQARGMAAQLNTRLGQILVERIKGETGYAKVFSDALKWREYQRQQVPQRTEIPGSNASAVTGQNSAQKPPVRQPNGDWNPKYLEYLEGVMQQRGVAA